MVAEPNDMWSTNYNFVEYIVGSLSNLVYAREVLDLGPVGISPLEFFGWDKAAYPRLVKGMLLEQLADVKSDRLASLSNRKLGFASKDNCLTCSIVRTHSICPARTQLVLTTSVDSEETLAGESLTSMVNVVNRESESRKSAVSGPPRRGIRDLRGTRRSRKVTDSLELGLRKREKRVGSITRGRKTGYEIGAAGRM
jgi:hypothetical protein